jgi:lysophospholipase L1-like esterase
MSTNSHERQQRDDSGNWFTRHSVAAISTLLTIVLLLCLVTLELFLRTFSGLGNPPLYELSPLYGYRLKANQSIKPWGNMSFLYGAGVTTNNLGLRAANEWDLNQTGKILFLGDSVTYGGQYIADAQLFSSVAGSRLQEYQVGNGGNNAWGVENIAGFIVDYGFSHAEVIVTCVIEGDFYRGITRASSMPLWTKRPRFALQDLLMHYVWKANESRYNSTIDLVIQDESHLDRIVDRAAKRLKDLDNYLKQHQVRHFLFILPTRAEMVDGETPDSRVSQALKRYELDADYLLPELLILEPDIEKRREWFRDEVHLEPPGHKAYGILIGDFLANALLDK